MLPPDPHAANGRPEQATPTRTSRERRRGALTPALSRKEREQEVGSPVQQGPQDWLSRKEREQDMGSPVQQGPQDWLRQSAGAAAPSGGRE